MTDALLALERAQAEFTDYFARNYPGPNTVIGNPHWHAPKIFRAVLHALRTRPPIQEPTDGGVVERVAPFEEIVAEAYQRGWHEGIETLIEDYPDALIAMPHKDALTEGCGTFMGEVWLRLAALTQSPQRKEMEDWRNCEFCGWTPDCGREGCRVCDHGYY